MIILRTQISGELDEIWAQMPRKSKRIRSLKLFFCKRFGISAEPLRQKFRALTKKPKESYSHLGANMMRYLEKWLEPSEVQTLEDMKNIIGLEQFLSVLPGELRYLVKDKKPKIFWRPAK